jgi:hypothetical protein
MLLDMLVVGSSTVLAQDTDPASIMHEFSITAVGDPDAALALLAEDVTIQIVPPPPGQSGVWSGLDEARGFLQFTQQQNAQRELVGEWEVEGNNVRGTVMVTANQLVAWGVAPVEHVLEATVENGKITSWSSMMTPAEQERVAAARGDAAMPDLPATGHGGCDDRDCYSASRRVESKRPDHHSKAVSTGRAFLGEGLTRHEVALDSGDSECDHIAESAEHVQTGAEDASDNIEYERRIKYLEEYLRK